MKPSGMVKRAVGSSYPGWRAASHVACVVALLSTAGSPWAQAIPEPAAGALPAPDTGHKLPAKGQASVMKCVGGGKTWYQDVACPPATAGTKMHGLGGTTTPSTAQIIAADPSPENTVAAAPAKESAPAASATPAKGVVPTDAQLCLSWYQREIALARGANYLTSSRQGRVLTVKVSMTNVVTNINGARLDSVTEKSASCEILSGKLDDGWTRIHAQRGGWLP